MVPEGKTEDCPTNLGHTSCTHQVGDCPGKTCTPIHFAHPPGIDNLDGKHVQYANIAAEDIIKGYVQGKSPVTEYNPLTKPSRSLETHKANGNKNGGGTIDYNKIDMFLAMSDDKPIIAGMYRLPICNVQVAVKNWKTGKRTDDNYPC